MHFFSLLYNLIRHLGDDSAWKAVVDAFGVHNLYAIIGLIVFVETGLVIMPFLPGDSLLFAVGTMTARDIGLSLPVAMGVLFAAAIIGDNCNYWLGRKLGPAVFHVDETAANTWKNKLLNRKHLTQAQTFYETYGKKTIVMARFVPIVRTFAPFVAGIGKMPYLTFLAYSVVGGAAWVSLCVLAGWWFGSMPFVKAHFELIVLAIIAISLVPVAFEFLKSRREKAAVADQPA